MLRPLGAAVLALATATTTAAAVAVGAAAAPPAAVSTASTGVSTASVATPADVALVRVTHSLTGSHAWFAQRHHGLEVIDAYWVRHTSTDGQVRVVDGRRSVPADVGTTPLVSAARAQGAAAQSLAVSAAREAVAPKRHRLAGSRTSAPTLAVFVTGGSAHLVWRTPSTSPTGRSETLVDARTGSVLLTRQVTKDLAAPGPGEASARIFWPNAVVTSRNGDLTDRRNSDYPALTAAMRPVTLAHLDGSGRMSGAYATVLRSVGPLATVTQGAANYPRSDNRFEQVAAYFGITSAQDYLRQLGFTDVVNRPLGLNVDTVPDDNSWYDPSNGQLTFGRGGVDDAEDLEVVWHEYGHAIQDSIVPGFGSSLEAGSIGEGFGDYFAVSRSRPVSNGFDLPCVMDWDATSYTSGPSHCLRRVDTDKTVADVEGEVHADGEIWSRALWDIQGDLGRTRADTVILEATYSYAPDTSFRDAATETVEAARRLYGDRAAAHVARAFRGRGIL